MIKELNLIQLPEKLRKSKKPVRAVGDAAEMSNIFLTAAKISVA